MAWHEKRLKNQCPFVQLGDKSLPRPRAVTAPTRVLAGEEGPGADQELRCLEVDACDAAV